MAESRSNPFQYGWDPIMLNQLSAIQNTTTIARRDLVNQMMDPRRNLDDECGYPSGTALPVELYRSLYDRMAIANRVVQMLPKESWQEQPSIYEDEDPNNITSFEEAWDALGNGLTGKSWHQEELGNNIWDKLVRADILSGIGHFGVILLGLDDGRPLQEPIEGVVTPFTRDSPPTVEERVKLNAELDLQYDSFELFKKQYRGNLTVNGWGYRPTPREEKYWGAVDTLIANTANGNGVQNLVGPNADLSGTDAQYFGPQFGGSEMPSDKPSKKSRKLLFLKVFDETLVQVVRYEYNINNPRFGLPIMYRITLNDPREQHSGIGLPLATVYVHWSRIIHIADNLGSSEIFGVPRQRPVLNHILDLRKIYGADGEGFWRNSFMKLSLETHPTLGGDVVIDEQDMKDTMENMMNGLQQWMYSSGLTVKPIAPAVSDPTPHINVHIEAICIALGCPVRVFKGSERGELASSQDDSAWNDRLRHRQDTYISPRILTPFIDRLILVGVLPEPGTKGKEKAAVAENRGYRVKRVTNGYLCSRFIRNAAPVQDAEPPGIPLPKEKADGAKIETQFISVSGYIIKWPDLDSLSDLDRATLLSTRTTAYSAYIQSGMEQLIPPHDYMTKFDSMTDDEARAVIDNAIVHEEEMLKEQEEQAAAAAEEAQALADEQGFNPAPPEGFEKPEQQPPQVPVKVKPGEKLVFPKKGGD